MARQHIQLESRSAQKQLSVRPTLSSGAAYGVMYVFDLGAPQQRATLKLSNLTHAEALSYYNVTNTRGSTISVTDTSGKIWSGVPESCAYRTQSKGADYYEVDLVLLLGSTPG